LGLVWGFFIGHVADTSIVLLFTMEREAVMPYFEKRGDKYRIVFHLSGKRYRHTLITDKESVARSVVGSVEHTIMLIEQRALQIPDGLISSPSS
jgi:hypothetical protein